MTKRRSNYRKGFHKGASIHVDTGCEYHSRCLTCPFDICIKHEGPRKGKIKTYLKQVAVVNSINEGLSVAETAARHKMGVRYVQKILRDDRTKTKLW